MGNKTGNMETMRAYKFRIYPDTKRQAAIDDAISLSQRLYNKLLEKTINTHKNNPSSKISQRTINQFLNEIIKGDKTYLQLYAHVRVDIRNKLLKTYQNFFRRCQQKKSGARIKAGFPRFKSKDRFNSITHIENNGSFRMEKAGKKNMLRISKIGRVQIEQHRNMTGNVKTMTIKREGNDYYAIFTAEQIIKPKEVIDANPVGIDMGLKNFIALSDGKTKQKPKFFKQKEKRIARWQRIVARRKKDSKRREKAKLRLQEEWKDTTNQSNDFMHKLSTELVNSGYTSFAVETLNIQNMEKDHRLAQAIQNASWNRFINMLSYKAESAGMGVYQVDPKDTTQECSNCHNIKQGEERLTPNDRIYHCNICGLTIDRDKNASINILNRARAGLARTNAQGENRQYIPTGNANGLDELRTYPANAGEANDL